MDTEESFPTKDLQDRLILHEKAVRQILLLGELNYTSQIC